MWTIIPVTAHNSVKQASSCLESSRAKRRPKGSCKGVVVQVQETLCPGLLPTITQLPLDPAVGVTDHGWARKQENALQGMAPSLKPTGTSTPALFHSR